ncbi:hypothetical protein, variant [Phytophthora nicotianae P1976]|uniref:Uncharacterized protein n=1 Tax=Phytophthora nicotianae P1976 TaxID=1317066 RepID=A0A081AFZ3_PHYNI|nr:hypothetical protein, variant [Phytophthora nicotianae P1976]
MGPEASAPLIVRVLVHRNEREVIGRKRQLQPKKRAKTRLTTLHFYETSKVRTELTFFVGEQVFAVILPAINSPTASSRCCGSLTITGCTLCPIRFFIILF